MIRIARVSLLAVAAQLGVVQLGMLTAAPALMPMPVKVESGSGWLKVDRDFGLISERGCDPGFGPALFGFTARITRQTGVLIRVQLPVGQPSLVIECAAPVAAWPSLGDDESYQLDVTPSGVRLKAASGSGALHGLETLAQLIEPGPDGFRIAAVHIEDRPRFPWRGLMMDVSRHWMPVEVVERNLEAMAAVKLNVFHWHLSDDQGFRVESKRFPRLHQFGSDGDFYTQEQIKHVVEYARDRGIRIVPEFDMPGHTQSWLAGYPELATVPGTYEIGRTWGAFDPVMDPTREETYQFLGTFITEMAALFPDAYFHIGGDEVNPKQWNASAKVQAFLREHNLKDAHALQAYFNQRLEKILEKNGKIMIGWDEILHPDLPSSIVIQSWRGQQALADAAKQGRRGILSWGYYLDHLSTAGYHYGVDPLNGAAALLTPEQAANVLGGEACMWAEYVNAETVDSRVWPRAAAIAERLWSAKDVTDVDSMYARMEIVSRNLEWTGVQHRSNYAPMLARLTGGSPAEPLRVLAEASEGQGLGVRSRGGKYTSLTPLNRFADAARPESESVRALELAARSAKPADLALLRVQFSRWASNDARFQTLAIDNPMLTELKPLSKDLSVLGTMGLRVLDYMAGAGVVPAGWIAAQNTELTRMQRPNAEVVLAGARPVKLLLDRLAKK